MVYYAWSFVEEFVLSYGYFHIDASPKIHSPYQWWNMMLEFKICVIYVKSGHFSPVRWIFVGLNGIWPIFSIEKCMHYVMGMTPNVTWIINTPNYCIKLAKTAHQNWSHYVKILMFAFNHSVTSIVLSIKISHCAELHWNGFIRICSYHKQNTIDELFSCSFAI